MDSYTATVLAGIVGGALIGGAAGWLSAVLGMHSRIIVTRSNDSDRSGKR